MQPNDIPTRINTIHHVTDVAHIRALLNPQTPLPAQLLSRALANANTMQAFNTHSTMTSPDAQIHDGFVGVAAALIGEARGHGAWWDLARVVRDSVAVHLPVGRHAIAFETYSQVVTLRTLLIQCFEVDPAVLGEHDLAAVAHGIRLIGRASETGGAAPLELSVVNGHLHRWLPNFPNPLDFILSTYCLIWPVVAIAVSYAHRDITARRAFEHFMGLPNFERFRARVVPEGVSVEAFIRETLRLHPPVRQIARVSGNNTYIADIEAVQRDPAIWGPDAGGFDPARFNTMLAVQQQESLLVFGHGPLACIARGWAPGAIAIMAGAILERVGEESEFRLVEPEGANRSGDWDGWRICEIRQD